MATLLTADGRFLKAIRPAGAQIQRTSGMFPAMWSDGERWGPHGVEDGYLRSYEQIYRSQPAIAGVVDKLSRRIATLPFCSYRKEADGSREMIEGDSLATLLAKPMPRRSTVHLLHHVAQSMLIHGNAVVAKVRLNGPDEPPDMLWPLDWAQMGAYGPVGGTIEWWSTTQFGTGERYFSTEDILLFGWPAPSGSEIGVSPLEKLGVTIRLDDAAQRHQTAMFRNGSRPSLAVSLADENPKADTLEFTRQRVEQMHKGVDNSGRTFFMGANVKLQPLSLTPVEAELVEQRRLAWEEVGMVYDMAGPLMGDMRRGTYANVEELLRSLYRDVVPPWTTLVEQTFQAQLLDPEPAWLDRFLAFDFTDKLKGTPEELSSSLKTQVEAGLTTRNEARRILNMPPIGDPNDPENPANMLTVNANNQATLQTLNNPAQSSIDSST